jgi:hypothetical protein
MANLRCGPVVEHDGTAQKASPVEIEFARGASRKTLVGTLSGRQQMDYIAGHRNQMLIVRLGEIVAATWPSTKTKT